MNPQSSKPIAEAKLHSQPLPQRTSRTWLPRADGVSPAHQDWPHPFYTERYVSRTASPPRLLGMPHQQAKTYPRFGPRADRASPSHGIPRDVQLEHGWARSHLSFFERQKLQLIWGCLRRRGASSSTSAVEFDMRRFMAKRVSAIVLDVVIGVCDPRGPLLHG